MVRDMRKFIALFIVFWAIGFVLGVHFESKYGVQEWVFWTTLIVAAVYFVVFTVGALKNIWGETALNVLNVFTALQLGFSLAYFHLW